MLSLLLALAATAQPADAAIGRWRTETKNGVIQIERCGASICGRLADSDGLRANPGLKDANNKEAALRSRPLKGVSMLSGFKWDGAAWTGGTIYNPEDGRTYSAKITTEGANTLKMRGCVFVPLCKTQTWTRAR